MSESSSRLITASPISNSLACDLALVIGDSPQAERSVALAPVAEVAEAIRQSSAPAIAGLGGITIEGVRQAVRLAEMMRGRLLPWPMSSIASDRTASVHQGATLGHVFSSDLVIWVGGHADWDAITRRIAEHQLRAVFAGDDLETVLKLRAALAGDVRAEPLGKYKRVAVALGPGVDARVASQWHQLAAQVQSSTRVCVVALPDLETHGNLRGALEVIAWQTGLSCAEGGVDFADGSPRACADYVTLMGRGVIDLVIDTSWAGLPTGDELRRGVASPSALSQHPARIAFPRFTSGLAAQVMRFDGTLLWLCDDPTRAPADPVAAWLEQLADAIGRSA